MEEYDWSHHDHLQREQDWHDDQRRWDELRRDHSTRDSNVEAGRWLTFLVCTAFVLVFAYFALIFVLGTH